MILTSTTLIFFLLVGVAALAIGIFSKTQMPYYLGVIIIFFLGLMVLQLGISEKVGESILTNTTSMGLDSMASTTTDFVYAQSSSVWTNGIGLLLVVIAAGLTLNLYKAGKDEEQRKRDSIEVED